MVTPCAIAGAAGSRPADPCSAAAERVIKIGGKPALPLGLKSYPRTLALADREVVLTFDDGPGATTAAVLDALKAACVHATFFMVGGNATAQPDVVRRALAEGHTLGHHTFSHPDLTLRRLPPDLAKMEISRGIAADEVAAYGTTGAVPRVPFFRFPGFADTPLLDTWLAARGIIVFGTDLWAYDWLDIGPDTELRLLMTELHQRGRGIILLHDTRLATARMMPRLLVTLKREGFRIVHLVPGDGAPATMAAPSGWASETDRVIAEVFAREAASARTRRADFRRHAHLQRHHGWRVWIRRTRAWR